MAEKDSIRYIKNWWKFQHYKDRRPSWIKLYEEILDDAIIQSLTPPDFKRIITLWLRSSKHGGTLDVGQPNLWQTLGFGQRGSCSDFLERLEAKGLISKEDIRGADDKAGIPNRRQPFQVRLQDDTRYRRYE